MKSAEGLLKNAIKLGIFILPFLPFVVTDSLFFPFITGKNFAFRIIVEILLVLWVMLVLKNRTYLPRRSLLLWSVAILFAVLVLATVFSINPYKSFWSNAERMEGLFGMLHLLALFVIMAGVFKERDWMQFFGVTLVASIGVAFHAIGQLAGFYETHRGTRMDSNFGNSTYFAIYAIFMIFLSAYVAYVTGKGKVRPFGGEYNRWITWGLGALGVVYVILLYLNATRGALLGFLGGAFLVALLLTIFSRGKHRRKGAIALAVLVLIPILFMLAKNTAVVQSSPVLKRFADISLTEQTTESRLTLWSLSYEAWKDRPILGWGPENFTTVFSQHYVPKLWKQEAWFDRSHNVLFDWLVGAGVLGLLAYLSLYITALIVISKAFRRGTLSLFEGALLVGLLAAHFVHNLFVFDNLISYLFFFAFLAYIHHRHVGDDGGEGDSLLFSPSVRYAVGTGVVLVVVSSLYFFNIKPIQASRAIIGALTPLSVPQLGTQNIESAQAALQRTIGYNTFLTTEAREQLVTRAVDVSNARLADQSSVRAFLEYAQQEGEAQVERFEHDMRMRTFLASLYVQVREYEKGEVAARVLVERAPTRPLFYLILGEAHLGQREYEEADEAFETAYTLAPDYPLAQEGYAMALIKSGEVARGKQFTEQHFGSPHPPLPRIVQAYIEVGLYGDAALSAEALVASDPGNITWHFNLAKLYVVLRRDAEAIAELQRVVELEPRLAPSMQVLINQIRDGTVNREL